MLRTVLKYRSYPSVAYTEPSTVPIINRTHSLRRNHIKSSARDIQHQKCKKTKQNKNPKTKTPKTPSWGPISAGSAVTGTKRIPSFSLHV